MPSPPTLPLSVLDLAPIAAGSSARRALRNSVDLARHAERLGYRRYWVAEHHLTAGVAAAAPAPLVALLASATSRIRVGSGAVLLGNYAPAAVAEQFGTVAALHPGRVDLGLGRSGQHRLRDAARLFDASERPASPGGRTVDGVHLPARPPAAFRDPAVRARLETLQALLHPRPDGGREYLAEVTEILDLLAGRYRAADGTEVRAPAAEGADLAVWIFGSSAGASASAAGRLSLPYVSNYHVSPATVVESADAYRAAFVPSAARPRPYLVVSADVVVAEDAATARHLASPHARWVLSIRAGDGAIPYPHPDESATVAWTDAQRALVADRVRTQLVGDPETVVRRLAALRDLTGADELVVTTVTHDHADRVRSYELLAEAWRRAQP